MTRIQKARTRQGPCPAPPPGPPAKHTGRLRILIGLAVVVAALTAFVTPGFAEFESGGSENKGKGEIFEALIYDGGTEVICQTPEGTSNATWTVKKGTEEAKKGSTLSVNIENWGECAYLTASQASGTAKLSACTITAEQTGEQSSVPGTIPKVCTITIGACEIKIIPEQKAEVVELRASGEAGENTSFNPELSKVGTEVNKECAQFGIQSSKAVFFALTGLLENVKTAAPVFKFKPGGGTAAEAESASKTYTFTFEKEEVTCPETKFKNPKITTDVPELKLKPKYNGTNLCNTKRLSDGAVANNRVTVTVAAGCELVHRVGSHNLIPPKRYHGSIQIVGSECLKFKGTVTNANNCERKIGPQTGLRLKVDNEATGREIELTTEAKTLEWNSPGGAECEGETAGLRTNGKYAGGVAKIGGLLVG